MARYDYDLGIIGGGAAGLTVGAGAARLGARTLLVEKEPQLGGDCLHYGCVPSKTLISSARIWHSCHRSKEFGLPPLDLPPVDFARVAARIRSVIATLQIHDSVERFCGLGVRVAFGDPCFVDNHSIELDGKTVSARNWVLATGSRPGVPPLRGLEHTSYLTNKEIFSLQELPESLIILGAGPIATEMAQAFARLGSRVTVIQRSDQILSKEDKDMADTVMAAMETEGVRFYLGASVAEVRNHGNQRQVDIVDAGGRAVTVTAAALLVALGRRPNIEGLGLEAAGVEVTSRGITVDQRLRTSQSHIYAAGDVNGAFPFTHAAGYEGGIVIANAIFHLPRRVDYTWMPWVTYSDPELASIGMNEKRARLAGIDYQVWTEKFRDNDRAQAEGAGEGRIKMILDAAEKPLGVQIVGPRAGDLMGEWVAALNGRVKLSTLAGAVHPYPTLVEINKRVAGSFISSKLFSPVIRKGLQFFFNLKGAACDPASDLR